MGIVIFILLMTLVLSIPVWLLLTRLKKIYFWDYGISFYGVILWIVLTFFYVGGQSLTNAVLEPFYINIFSILIILIRFFLSKKVKVDNKMISVIGIILVIGFALLLKILIPTLPE